MVPSYKDGVEFIFALGFLEKYDDRPHFEARLEDVFKEEWDATYVETQDFLAAVWKVYDKCPWRHASVSI